MVEVLADRPGHPADGEDREGKVATRREVRFGRRNPNSIEVLGGLLDGDEVIISSYANFIEVERLFIDD